ncbi:MAG: polysaccharide deacetylase family protein [Clostridia bacterium]|nr:polysaccharide deacetylase family protein [Clostridia bacterium]
MRVYFLSFARLWPRLLLVGLVLSVLILGYGITRNKNELPTTKPYEAIYQGSSEAKKVALICNVVWGEEFLPEMLEILRKQDVKMTFFIGGQWAEQFPELTELIYKTGHEIGNHGYAHRKPSVLSKEQNLTEIKKAEAIINDITKQKTTLFHPPYRDINDIALDVANQNGYKVIMSSVDTIDWQRPAPEVITKRVIDKIHNGAIVLMHPTAPTVKALPVIIKELKNRGYDIVTVSELIKQ